MLSDVFARRSRSGVFALAILGVCVLRSVPGALVRAERQVAALLHDARETFEEARARVHGRTYVARLEEIRHRIPGSGAYFLVNGAVADAGNLVRRDLAPRQPILLGTLTGTRREFLIPFRPPGAPELVVAAFRERPPELLTTDAFLGTESVDPGREDVLIPASIDEPRDGATVGKSVMLSGWCQEPGGRSCSTVHLLLDGAPAPGRVERFSRPDVAAAVPGIGDCSTAGWRVVWTFDATQRGFHEATAYFLTADGRFRRIGPVRFAVAG